MSGATRPDARMRIGDWQLDTVHGVLRRDGEERHLPPRAVDVLVYLAARAGTPVSAEELRASLWPNPYSGDSAVHNTISKIRAALGDSRTHPRYLETVPKRGYCLVAPPADDSATLPTIAVAPLEVIGAAPTLERLAAVVREELLTELAETRWLTVAGRTASPDDPSFLVQGTVRADAAGALIALELVRPANGYQLWSSAYPVDVEERVEGTFWVGPNAGRTIEQAIITDFRIENAATDDPQAREHYAVGLQMFNRLRKDQDPARAKWQFERAVALDPDFTDAHIMLGFMHANRAGGLSWQEHHSRAHQHLDRALALSPGDPLAHFALGQVNVFLDLDYADAQRNFEKAREARATWALIDSIEGVALLMQGRHAQALERFTGATEDRAAGNHQLALAGQGIALEFLGRPEAAKRAYGEALRIAGDQTSALAASGLVAANAALGAWDEANGIANAMAAEHGTDELAAVYVLLGRQDEARAVLQRAEQRYRAKESVMIGQMVPGYAHLDDFDAAFRWLETALDERDMWSIMLMRSSRLPDAFLADPRFTSALQELETLETR